MSDSARVFQQQTSGIVTTIVENHVGLRHATSQYSSRVSPFHAKTGTPLAAIAAAA